MPELHELLERRALRYEPPLDLYERVLVRSRRRDLKRRVGAGLTAAAIFAAVAVAAWGLLRSRPTEPASQGDIPVEPTEIVRQVVEAANARDADLLASSFADDGEFRPYAGFGGGYPGPFPFAEVIPAWMDAAEEWGLEARVRSCEQLTESVVSCDVRTLWHTLQMEMGERWKFAFERGRLGSLVMVRSDLDPDDRFLPLSYTDLDRWESWLTRNHPRQAAVWLENDPRYAQFLRYQLAYADKIGASIEEYLTAGERLRRGADGDEHALRSSPGIDPGSDTGWMWTGS